MFRIIGEKPNRIVFVVAVYLSSLVSLHALASSTSNNASILSPIVYLLSEDEDEFGSLIPGKLYSAAELAMWQQRAQTGPHKVRGDAYGDSETGSYPDFAVVEVYANAFLQFVNENDITRSGKDRTYINNLTIVADESDLTSDRVNEITQAELAEIRCEGDCVVVGTGRHQKYDAFELRDFRYARDAAFYDLVKGTSVYTNRIKSILLDQVRKDCMDFSNTELFVTDIDQSFFFLTMEWVHKILKTYDYLDESVFTVSEKKEIEDWFKGAAAWAYSFISRRYEVIYSTRSSNPLNSTFNKRYSLHTNSSDFINAMLKYRHAVVDNKEASRFWPAGYVINNRELGQLNYIVHAGVKFGNKTWKEAGSQLFKEYLAFHFNDEGYFGELSRSTTTAGQELYGLAYGANTLIGFVEIVHILYLSGYENLYEYKTKVRTNPVATLYDLQNDTTVPIIEEGPVEKSLEWVFLQFRKNFMLSNAQKIYPRYLDENQESTDTRIHFCQNTYAQENNSKHPVGRMYNPAAIANRYYKNSQIKQMYNFSSDYGNRCQFEDSDLDIKSGPHDILPAILFQYSDADEKY